MKKLFIAVLFATAALAKSPFIGTWKLDQAKTKFSAGEPPQDETLVVGDAGDHAAVTVTGKTASGRPISMRYNVPAQGGAADIQEAPCDAMTITRTGENITDTVCTRRGRQIGTRHTVISDDGKTMSATVEGIDPLGRRVAGVEVYDKQ